MARVGETIAEGAPQRRGSESALGASGVRQLPAPRAVPVVFTRIQIAASGPDCLQIGLVVKVQVEVVEDD